MAKSDSGPGKKGVEHPLFGKRGAPRAPLTVPVSVRGSGLQFAGTTVDVSRTGVLFEVTPGILKVPPGEDLITYAQHLRRMFPRGIEVCFADDPQIVRAEIIRVACDSRNAQSLRVGCRFVTPLTHGQCKRLGVPPEGADVVDPTG